MAKPVSVRQATKDVPKVSRPCACGCGELVERPPSLMGRGAVYVNVAHRRRGCRPQEGA